MKRIDAIIEEGLDILEYLDSRQILSQYKKAKTMLIGGFSQKYDLKLRKPKNAGIYQFRINQKYRAFGFFDEEDDKTTFVVTYISDHQDS
jgi:plasmid maintenance system killer protein